MSGRERIDLDLGTIIDLYYMDCYLDELALVRAYGIYFVLLFAFTASVSTM